MQPRPPKPAPAPLLRVEVLATAATIYAACVRGAGHPDVDAHKADREISVMHAIELAKEVDRQLLEMT
jgi:hypothetical protein